MVKPSRRGPMVERLVGSYCVSETACLSGSRVARATYRYRSRLDPRTELRMRIREIAQARVRYGYRKIRVLLNREGWDVGKYLVYRLYKEEGLTLKRMRPAAEAEGCRSSRRTDSGLRLRTRPGAWTSCGSAAGWNALPRADDRGCVIREEAVAIEVGQSLKGDDVVRTLNQLKNSVECRSCCSVTTAASSPVRPWIYGLIATALRSTSRGQASQQTTPSLKASTEPCE